MREEEESRAYEERKHKELDKIDTMKNQIVNRRNVRELGKKIFSKDNKQIIILERVNESIKVSNNPSPKKKWRTDLCDPGHYD